MPRPTTSKRAPRAGSRPAPLLAIKNLSVVTAEGKKPILNGLSLTIPASGIHVIMGQNGSGKSTLCNVLLGHSDYEITGGSLHFNGANIAELPTNERAARGMFLAFQHPREIPGVSLLNVMRAAKHEAIEKSTDRSSALKGITAALRDSLGELALSDEFMKRPLNEHASGGEKKRLEMAQLFTMAPKLAILDEIDSGLDIDAMKRVAAVITKTARVHGTAFLIITHYQRLLNHLPVDTVSVMRSGAIVKTGGPELARALEENGYGAIN